MTPLRGDSERVRKWVHEGVNELAKALYSYVRKSASERESKQASE